MRCYLPVFLVALVLLSLSILYTQSDHRGHLDQAPVPLLQHSVA